MVDHVPWYKAITSYQEEISYKMKNSLQGALHGYY